MMQPHGGRALTDADLHVHALHDNTGRSVFIFWAQNRAIAFIVRVCNARVIGLAALELVHVDVISGGAGTANCRAAISVLWCLARTDERRREELLEKVVKGFAKRGQRGDEDADGEFGAGPDCKVDTVPSWVLRCRQGLELDSFENRADCCAGLV